MAKQETRRINPKDLQADQDALHALESISAYKPVNAAYITANVQKLMVAMQAAQKAEVQAMEAARIARDNATAAEWALHNAILGVKMQVAAQFGKDSGEIQMLGLKRKSEYKSPRARKVQV